MSNRLILNLKSMYLNDNKSIPQRRPIDKRGKLANKLKIET
jgi:hypothetical protein